VIKKQLSDLDFNIQKEYHLAGALFEEFKEGNNQQTHWNKEGLLDIRESNDDGYEVT